MKKTIYTLVLLLTVCLTGLQAQNAKLSKEEFRNRQKEFSPSRRD